MVTVYYPFNTVCNPFFCPLNGKPLVSIFALQVTYFLVISSCRNVTDIIAKMNHKLNLILTRVAEIDKHKRTAKAVRESKY